MDLETTYKDDFGDPVIRITNKFTDQDLNIAEFGIKKCKVILEEMGADIIDEVEVPKEFSHVLHGGHYAGGAFMLEDPKTSAVNNYLYMWDVDNLFVVGVSAFPQFVGILLTSTIGALVYCAVEG